MKQDDPTYRRLHGEANAYDRKAHSPRATKASRARHLAKAAELRAKAESLFPD